MICVHHNMIFLYLEKTDLFSRRIAVLHRSLFNKSLQRFNENKISR